MAPSQEIFDDLRTAYADGKLIIFAGAGISKAGGLPTWPELAKQLRDRIATEGRRLDTLPEIDELIRQGRWIDALSGARAALGDTEFFSAIKKAVDDEPHQVPDVAKAIAELKPRLRAVLTTNLDRFLERAFGGDWETFSAPTADIASQPHYILKLHGTRRDHKTWVFTRDQYDQAMFGSPLTHTILQSLFNTCPILFVGYGLADDDFDQMLGKVRALAGTQPPTHFALVRSPVPPLRRHTLERSGLRLLEYKAHVDVPGILRSIP
ncbi:SIR2 family protein [Sorangium sp. So ce134]